MVLNERVVEIGAWRNFDQHPQINLSGDLPDVPVLPGTLLLMEFYANGRSIDLNEISQLVLGDLGATIQIMRRAGQECSSGEERLNRIEDCISTLGLQTCIEAMSRRTVMRSMNKPAILKAWSHGRDIAENCRSMAAEMPRNTSPDEAYLTGLLHELGSLPEIFGWDPELGLPSDPDLAGMRLAEAWSLPRCVFDYFCEIRRPKSTHRWAGIVQRAHELLSLSSDQHSMNDNQGAQVVAFDRMRAASL